MEQLQIYRRVHANHLGRPFNFLARKVLGFEARLSVIGRWFKTGRPTARQIPTKRFDLALEDAISVEFCQSPKERFPVRYQVQMAGIRAVIHATYAIRPRLLNEVAFNYNGNGSTSFPRA